MHMWIADATPSCTGPGALHHTAVGMCLLCRPCWPSSTAWRSRTGATSWTVSWQCTTTTGCASECVFICVCVCVCVLCIVSMCLICVCTYATTVEFGAQYFTPSFSRSWIYFVLWTLLSQVIQLSLPYLVIKAVSVPATCQCFKLFCFNSSALVLTSKSCIHPCYAAVLRHEFGDGRGSHHLRYATFSTVVWRALSKGNEQGILSSTHQKDCQMGFYL